jgi:hypothetical protein
MQILYETTYLAPGQAQSAADIVLNGSQIVDEADFFRAATKTYFPRGNLGIEFAFSVWYVFPTSVAAEIFLLTIPGMLPMTNTDNGVLQCNCGAETPATSQIAYMAGAVLKDVQIKQVGVSVMIRYSFVGPGFSSSVPQSGLPTFPNPNEINQVFRRGKIAITLGATTVAVVFSSQLPGLPGADPYCWVSGPTGAEMFTCETLTDTVTTLGFTAALGEAAPAGGYYLNYAVFM